MRILIIDDEPKILSLLRNLLQQEQHFVDTARLAKTALKKIHSNSYDLIILDLLLPDRNGMELCEEIRAEGVDIPILMLTCLDSTTDKVKGLEKGADDYLTKPFNFKELLARINSLSRRQRAFADTILEAGNLSLNTETYAVKRGGKVIHLPGKQFALLKCLLAKKNKIVSKEKLVVCLWGGKPITSNALEVLVRRLRGSIDRNYKEKLIETIRGVGYRIKSI